MITLALSKGRIFDETLPLLAAVGIVPVENPETSRKLIIEVAAFKSASSRRSVCKCAGRFRPRLHGFRQWNCWEKLLKKDAPQAGYPRLAALRVLYS